MDQSWQGMCRFSDPPRYNPARIYSRDTTVAGDQPDHETTTIVHVQQRRTCRQVNQLRAAAGEGKTARKHLRKWASVRSVRDSEDAFGAGTYARTGARAESPALGRAVSASDLTANDMAPISKDQLIQRWTVRARSTLCRWERFA